VSISPSYRRALPILLLLGVHWAYSAYDHYRLCSYGAAYNPIRQQLGLPLVGADWQAIYSDDEVSFVNPNQQAAHTRKRVFASWSGVAEEADLVILPASKGTLDMVFIGSVATSTATLYATRETFKMPYAQALDTLKKYRVVP
jgi:hypothetical protein